MSRPFRTVCAPPDTPPRCPRTRQLESDPLVAGGAADTGALLATPSSSTQGRVRMSAATGRAFAVSIATVPTAGAGEEGEVAAAAAAARQAGGDACHMTEGMKGEKLKGKVGGEVGGLKASGEEEDEDGRLGECRRDGGGEGGWRQGRRRDKKQKQRGSRKSDGGSTGNMVSALVEREEEGRQRVTEWEGEVGEGGSSVHEEEARASTSVVLEWDAGCANGAIITNYEVRGEEKRGEDTC